VSDDSSRVMRVMHALRIKGLAGDDALARMTGLAPTDAEASAAELTESGLVEKRTGRFAGWVLTGPGRQRYEELLVAERDRVASNPDLRQAYEGFVALNERFKALCTAWQLRDLDTQLLNNHEDPVYDAQVIHGLGEIDDAVMPIIGQLTGVLSRFGGYGGRLTDCLRRVRAGERDAFTRPLSESYHDVWMELHQDLLLTMGIIREAAGA
jgi:hypothetical protein